MAEVTLDQIVRLMVGRDLTELFPRVPHEPGEALLDLDALSGEDAPTNVNLTVRRGEILGLAGLVGAGRTELIRCIFGLDKVRSGQVRLHHLGAAGRSPRSSIRSGMGFVSEDRKEEGLALGMSIADNLTFTSLSPYGRFGWLSLRRRQAAVRQWMQRIECKAAGPNQAVGELSGGNQQKIAIARLLHQQADLLLFDEPTRGIDIGTKAQIYRLLGELAAANKAVIMVSSYLPELLNVCDRIGVMCRGRLREVRNAKDWSEEQIMHVATGREMAA
jgi:ribose transport system ATP-binding protein